jgi:hypothetical protein
MICLLGVYGAICLLAPLQSDYGFVGFLIATRLWLVDVKMFYRPWDCKLSQVHCNCLRCYELILEQFYVANHACFYELHDLAADAPAQ